MSNISGLGLGLMDLNALKKLSEQQNVNGEKANKKEQGVTNVFEEIGGLGSEGTSAVIDGENVPEITNEDLEALENGEENTDKEKANEEKSAIQALTGAIKELVGLITKNNAGGISSQMQTTPPAGIGTALNPFGLKENALFISEYATVSELEQIKQETLNKYNNEINGKEIEKEQFLAEQENKKSNINSRINQQKVEIDNTKKEIENTNSQISSTESEISATESKISSLKSALSSLDSEDENAAQKRSEIEAKIQELESKKSDLEMKKTNLETQKTNLEKELTTAETQLKVIETEFKNVEAQTSKQVQVFEQEISSLENSKNSEISKIDLKISQAKANENSQKTDTEKEEEEKVNIFTGV